MSDPPKQPSMTPPKTPHEPPKFMTIDLPPLSWLCSPTSPFTHAGPLMSPPWPFHFGGPSWPVHEWFTLRTLTNLTILRSTGHVTSYLNVRCQTPSDCTAVYSTDLSWAHFSSHPSKNPLSDQPHNDQEVKKSQTFSCPHKAGHMNLVMSSVYTVVTKFIHNALCWVWQSQLYDPILFSFCLYLR